MDSVTSANGPMSCDPPLELSGMRWYAKYRKGTYHSRFSTRKPAHVNEESSRDKSTSPRILDSVFAIGNIILFFTLESAYIIFYGLRKLATSDSTMVYKLLNY